MTAASVAKVALVAIFALSVSYGCYKLCKLGHKLFVERRAFSRMKNAGGDLVDSIAATHNAAIEFIKLLKTPNTIQRSEQVEAAKVYLETIPKAVAAAKDYTGARERIVSIITPLNGGPIKKDKSEALARLDSIINPLLEAVALHKQIREEVYAGVGFRQNTTPTVERLLDQIQEIDKAIHTARPWVNGENLL